MGEESHPDLREPLGRWLEAHLDGAERVQVGEPHRHEGGYSAETIIVPLRVTRAGRERDERAVLRLEVDEPAIYPVQAPGLDVEVHIQYRTMEALQRVSKLPLAPLFGYEPDRSVLGNAFFVMGFVEGVVPSVNPPYPAEGFFADASPAERRRLFENGLRVLADVHAIDWRAAGFDWLVPPDTEPGTRAQVELWHRFAERELKGRVHPVLDAAWEYLYANMPEDASIGLSWGDSRPGNIIWRDFEPVCLTDFENVAIGPPLLDLGWWIMFDATMHETNGVPRLDGEPTREEMAQIYAGISGRDVSNVRYYEILAAARYCGIVARVMNRYVERGLMPADAPMWIQNPPTTVLAGLMDMPVPEPPT